MIKHILQVPRWGTFSEYLQHMVMWRNKKIIYSDPPSGTKQRLNKEHYITTSSIPLFSR